jgi:hypothetical protein
MIQLAGQSTTQITDAELANGLANLFFDGQLTHYKYDKAIQELIRRKFAPEALGTLILLGEPEWQKTYRQENVRT